MNTSWQPPVPLPADPSHPRVRAALAELEALILQSFPDAQFVVTRRNEDPVGVFLTSMVDTDDLDAVTDVAMHRAVDFQVEEGIPVYLVAEWPPERIAAHWRERTNDPNAARPIPVLPLPLP